MAPKATATVSPEEILAALERDPALTVRDDFPQMKKHLVQLPKIFGPKRLAQVVTYQVCFQLTQRYVGYFLEHDFASDYDDPAEASDYYWETAEAFFMAADAVLDLDAPVFDHEDNAIFADAMRLPPEAKALFIAGTLTVADLLRHRPSLHRSCSPHRQGGQSDEVIVSLPVHNFW